jgi:hypothetical protein
MTTAKEDLKSLPMPELKATLGFSPDGLSQAEAEKRLTQYGPNEIKGKKTNPFLKFFVFFLADPVDDRSGRGPHGYITHTQTIRLVGTRSTRRWTDLMQRSCRLKVSALS